MAGVELDDLYGPVQPRAFCDSVVLLHSRKDYLKELNVCALHA